MTIELNLILKFLEIVKKREIETGKIISSEVKRECELKCGQRIIGKDMD